MGLGSGIRKKPIPDPESRSRGQKGTGSRIRIRNTDGKDEKKNKTNPSNADWTSWLISLKTCSWVAWGVNTWSNSNSYLSNTVNTKLEKFCRIREGITER